MHEHLYKHSKLRENNCGVYLIVKSMQIKGLT